VVSAFSSSRTQVSPRRTSTTASASVKFRMIQLIGLITTLASSALPVAPL
jgi:hypothetical protein